MNKLIINVLIIALLASCTPTKEKSDSEDADSQNKVQLDEEITEESTVVSELIIDLPNVKGVAAEVIDSIPSFDLHYMEHYKDKRYNYFVKSLDKKDGKTIHTWIKLFDIYPSGYQGFSAEIQIEIRSLKELNELTTESVTRKDVEDLRIYFNDSLIFGNFLNL